MKYLELIPNPKFRSQNQEYVDLKLNESEQRGYTLLGELLRSGGAATSFTE